MTFGIVGNLLKPWISWGQGAREMWMHGTRHQESHRIHRGNCDLSMADEKMREARRAMTGTGKYGKSRGFDKMQETFHAAVQFIFSV